MLVALADYAVEAKLRLPKNAYDYFSSGSNGQQTLADNEKAFQRYRLRPRILVDVSTVSTETTVLGHRVQTPIMIAPTAMQCMANPDGERATARAAKKFGALMVLSSWATSTIEDVATANQDGQRWFQLYVYKDREVTRELVRRAEANGYTAIVLTVDTPLLGRREADVRNGFSLPPHLTLANFTLPTAVVNQKTAVVGRGDSGLALYVASLIDQSLNWKDIEWLRSITKLPIIAKGVMTSEAAQLVVKHRLDGIIVSNHGARQLDGTFATIDVLEEVVKAVDGKVEVYLDGGIRRGTDVFKALALGAKAVFLGRPVLWGLACGGEDGVLGVLNLIQSEFMLAMKLAGCRSVAEIDRSFVGTNSRL